MIELGIWVEVEELASREQLTEEAALRSVVSGNGQVQRELATLGVLVAHQEASQGHAANELSEPALVKAYLQANGQTLRDDVLGQVIERNGEPLRDDALIAPYAEDRVRNETQRLRLSAAPRPLSQTSRLKCCSDASASSSTASSSIS